MLALIGVVPPALAVVVYRLRAGGPAEEGWRRGFAAAREHGWLGERLARYVVIAIGLTFFFWAFAAWKTHIPPFTMDPTLGELDRRLHGTDPYRSLSFGYRPWVTGVLAAFYYDWRYVLRDWCSGRDGPGPVPSPGRFWLALALILGILLGTRPRHAVPARGPAFTR